MCATCADIDVARRDEGKSEESFMLITLTSDLDGVVDVRGVVCGDN